MLDETFGDMLFCPESECLKEFPSPEELKFRVIISTKPPNEYATAKSMNDGRINSRTQKDSDDEWGMEPSELVENEQEDDDMVRATCNVIVSHGFSICLYF